MIPRFGEAVITGQRYRPRPGAYAVIREGGRVLLTFQQDPDAEFQLPGGGIDPGESALQALFREVREETGWTVHSPRRLGAFRRFAYMPEYDRWAEKICHTYLARPARRLGPPSEPGHTAFWVDERQAPALCGNAGDRHFLMRALALF